MIRRAFAALCALALGGCTSVPDEPGVTVLTYASPYSPQHPFSRADVTWMRWIEEHSGGTLRIKPYWSGTLLSSEQSLTELRHGVADIGLITPIYSRGGTHLIRAQAGFYLGTTTFAQQTALYRCLQSREPQLERELQGLTVLAVQGGNLPGILTRDRAVRTLEDLRGLRLRAPSELLGVLDELGADPVDMPMNEVYSALAKGVLDGVVAPVDTLRALHFAEVARYFNTIRIPRGAYPSRAMGERRWRELTDHQRALLERSATLWEEALDAEISAADLAGETAGREQGIVFFDMPRVDQERFNAIYDRDAERRARGLARYGIDGMASFQHAREIADELAASGKIQCEMGNDRQTA